MPILRYKGQSTFEEAPLFNGMLYEVRILKKGDMVVVNAEGVERTYNSAGDLAIEWERPIANNNPISIDKFRSTMGLFSDSGNKEPRWSKVEY